jgi:GTPase involved in cell partitioning and DNA repair
VSFENPNMLKAYETIREELTKYGSGLDAKDEIILLTKTDTTDEVVVAKELKKFEKLGKPVFAVTLFDENGVKDFKDELIKYLKKE